MKLASSIRYIRWNNIQQIVVPPICEISFLTNLGQAVARGGDIQGDVAMTDDLSLELSAGYTDARYIGASTQRDCRHLHRTLRRKTTAGAGRICASCQEGPPASLNEHTNLRSARIIDRVAS